MGTQVIDPAQMAALFNEGQGPEIEEQQEQAQPSQHEAHEAKLLEAATELAEQSRFTRERDEEFKFQQRRANLYARSMLFRDKKLDQTTALAQTMVRIDLGESLGFTPAQSLQGIYVINGVTAVSSALRADRMARAGYSWDIEWITGKTGECEGCRLWLKYQGKPMLDRKGEQVSEAFTKADATRMMTTIWENGKGRRASILEKDNWQMSPRNMYFARAVTNAQRFYAPHVLSANLPSIEEAQDFDTTDVSPIQSATESKVQDLKGRLEAAKQ